MLRYHSNHRNSYLNSHNHLSSISRTARYKKVGLHATDTHLLNNVIYYLYTFVTYIQYITLVKSNIHYVVYTRHPKLNLQNFPN